MSYGLAFLKLVPGAKWSCAGDMDVYENYTWLDDRNKPTKKQCDAVLAQAVAEAETKEQEGKRLAAYQVEADPLFFKAQAGEDGVTLETWQTKRQEIKERYPYPVV
jgi:hypothetical protein